MSFITQQTVAVTGQVLTAAIWNAEFQNIINTFNGGIDNSNIAPAAGIAYTKLALTGQILNTDLAGSIAATKITDTAVTLTASQSMTNKTMTGTIAYATVNPISTLTYGAITDLDLATSNHFFVQLTGNVTFSFTNGSDGQAFILHVKQGVGGNFLATWPVEVRWAGSVNPTLTTTGLKIDTFGFIKNGSDFYGYVIGKNI